MGRGSLKPILLGKIKACLGCFLFSLQENLRLASCSISSGGWCASLSSLLLSPMFRIFCKELGGDLIGPTWIIQDTLSISACLTWSCLHCPFCHVHRFWDLGHGDVLGRHCYPAILCQILGSLSWATKEAGLMKQFLPFCKIQLNRDHSKMQILLTWQSLITYA